ncbi:MAG: BrnT family toxin [Janthinobacterium lividum]
MTASYDGQGHFDWDPDKARSNFKKHRVTFEEALSAFRDPLSLVVPDPAHSETEDRLVLIGLSDRRRLLVIIYVERGDSLRLISARTADSDERREYEEEPG